MNDDATEGTGPADGSQNPWPPTGGGWPAQGWPPPPAPLAPEHPRATTALVLGIVSLVGAFACVLPIFLAPVAWVLGARAVAEIDAAPGRWRGRESARAGQVLGMVGTILLVLGGVVVLLFVGLTILPFLWL